MKFDIDTVKPSVRKLSDMGEVIFDREWLKSVEDFELYFMYRDLALDEDRKIIRRENLRYDITVIPAGNLGKEFVKTAGHYHPMVPKTNLSYPEIYQVLEGKAHYLLQKFEGGEITDVVLIEAEKNDLVIIPPNYGHTTINPSGNELKMANWVSRNFSSVYEPIREKKGAAYFELTDGKFIKNENYEKPPELREKKPIDPSLIGLEKGEDMYNLIRKSPEKLKFLNMPQDFSFLFRILV